MPAHTATAQVKIADLTQFRRLLDAVRKVVESEASGRHPTHLGGCIGVLSEPSCDCGLTDLRFAVIDLLRQGENLEPSAQSDDGATRA